MPERLTVGLIGCGAVAQRAHLPVLSKLSQVRVVALADPDPARLAAARRFAPKARAFGSADALIDEGGAAAVVIALPTAMHADVAVAALQRGLHVYLEKPIAMCLGDGDRIVRAWRRARTVGAIGFNYRRNPLYARGELLAFTDDDCEPHADWLASLDARLASHPRAAIGGAVRNDLDPNRFSTASQLLVAYLYDYYADDRRVSRRFFTTNNLALRARDFAELGGFDCVDIHETAEDRDLCDRWARSGRELVHAPEAIVHHRHDLGLASFCRQHFDYGRGAVHFHRARRAAQRVRLEPPGFYVGMLRFPLRAKRRDAAMQSVLLALSQMAYASGDLKEQLSV